MYKQNWRSYEVSKLYHRLKTSLRENILTFQNLKLKNARKLSYSLKFLKNKELSLNINLSQFKPEGKFKFPGINFNQSELRELRIDRDYATSAALFHNFTFQISKYILDYTMSLVIQDNGKDL